jgi:hypothetical protein
MEHILLSGNQSKMKTRITARIFVARELLGEESFELEESEIETLLPVIAKRHARLVGDRPFMLELEFLDEHDPLARYFRFGTDPAGMVIPIEIALSGGRA